MTPTAADIMTAPAIVVTVDVPMSHIAVLLATNHISAVPVCSSDRTLLGIISEADILRPLRGNATTRQETSASPTGGAGDFLDFLRGDHRKAGDVMIRHVIAAEEDMPLTVLADLMVRHGIKRMPVLRDGKVVGIVSRSDLVAAVARGMSPPAS